MRFEYFKGIPGKWYWRLRAANGRIVADSGQGYKYRRGCREAIRTVMLGAWSAEMVKVAG